jgi:phosphotransferase system HPr-like phosphotransfer protein
MKSFVISLSTANDVKEFVNILNRFTFEADLRSGRYTVDAKSILGIFSLDLSKPITLEVYNSESTDELVKSLAPFIK